MPRFGQPISRWSAPDLKDSVKKRRKGSGAKARIGKASVFLWWKVMRMG